jgi:cytochrome c biogenesis protein CcmG/thiol:disulfide interchange protein DsbE
MQWLKRFGDPYSLSAFDVDGKVGIDFGVYGVPETFVIDKKGVIRYKQIGPITPEALEKTLMPLIRELNA